MNRIWSWSQMAQGTKKRRPLIQRSVKTEAGVREIPLCDIALEAISNHIALYYTGNDEGIMYSRQGQVLILHHIIFQKR